MVLKATNKKHAESAVYHKRALYKTFKTDDKSKI